MRTLTLYQRRHFHGYPRPKVAVSVGCMGPIVIVSDKLGDVAALTIANLSDVIALRDWLTAYIEEHTS